jgi:hypothetical protein
MRERLINAIDDLPERERLVMTLYYYEETNMREIGLILGVVECRISQIHASAVLHLRDRLAMPTTPKEPPKGLGGNHAQIARGGQAGQGTVANPHDLRLDVCDQISRNECGWGHAANVLFRGIAIHRLGKFRMAAMAMDEFSQHFGRACVPQNFSIVELGSATRLVGRCHTHHPASQNNAIYGATENDQAGMDVPLRALTALPEK